MTDLAATMADRGLVLLLRGGAWGLPTACPACLPVYMYLKLARVAFTPQYATFQPDSDNLPVLEYGDVVGYGSDTGGIIGVLKRERICDLDEGLPDSAKADVNAYTSIVNSWLADALLYELWLKENGATVAEVYLSSLPWPINKAIDWKQRRSVQVHLGINTENASERAAELYRKAAAAYEALSVRLQDQTYFIAGKPTSLDAVVLGHILFIQHAPLELSILKEELNKHRALIVYAENLKKKILGDLPPTIFPKAYSPPPTTGPSSSSSRGTTGPTTTKPAPKKRTEKDKLFRKRAKYFVIAQVAAVLLYVVFAGIEVEDDGMEDDGGVDD
ncbi:metaxin [Marchantia polymorpha subsp. ruderalis]|uniref:Metaxin n=2 Tax=Marchantia polymorpha TaxID=3197 RepID=A0AAF6ARZ3_MARPO|nr:hypothetical protein MARPO_0001s0301 [Marchantia polymorpha]BBM99213.1 hypothetical protein Mp_1g19620 [Marchantia polymorpha subsp. ruderalis]|eukprot:PTQ50294.1 hypothetical protein MARPO_0001s0301 [Marchantia polymorpha]